VVGILDSNGLVTFANGGELVINEDGQGDYAVSFNANATSDMGSNLFSHFRVNDLDMERIKDSHAGDSGERGDLSASGILALLEGDIVTLHVSSGDASQGDVINVYQVNVNIKRIS